MSRDFIGLTPEDVAQSPLKRGDFLQHAALGVVPYSRKDRASKLHIFVTAMQTGYLHPHNVRVRLAECSRVEIGKLKGKQPIRYYLARCPECDLKIRTSRQWLETGTPRCFNEKCGRNGEPLDVEMGLDSDNPAHLGTDRAEMMREQRVAEGKQARRPKEESQEKPAQTGDAAFDAMVNSSADWLKGDSK